MNNKRGEEDSLEHVAKRVQKKPHGKVTANEPATKAAQVEVTVVEPSSPSPLRGILPTPPEVEKLVAREVARLPMTDAARQRVTDGFNLQYYFGGHDIAYRETDQGVEVLAVGLDEIGRLLRKL